MSRAFDRLLICVLSLTFIPASFAADRPKWCPPTGRSCEAWLRDEPAMEGLSPAEKKAALEQCQMIVNARKFICWSPSIEEGASANELAIATVISNPIADENTPEQELKNALATTTDPSCRAAIEMNLGTVAFKVKNNPDEAIDWYRTAAKDLPPSPSAMPRMKKAPVFKAPPELASCYAKLSREDIDWNMATVYLKTGQLNDFDDVIRNIAGAARRDPMIFEAGTKAMSRDNGHHPDYPRATRYFDQVVGSSDLPTRRAALVGRGVARFNTHDYAASIDDLEAARAMGGATRKETFLINIGLGYANAERQQYDVALAAYDRALKIADGKDEQNDVKLGKAVALTARAFSEQDSTPDAAKADANKAIDLAEPLRNSTAMTNAAAPHRVIAASNLLLAAMAAPQSAERRDYGQKAAAELASLDQKARTAEDENSQMVSYFDQGQFPKAIALLDELLQSNPPNRAALLHLRGLFEYSQGRPKKDGESPDEKLMAATARDLRESLQADPNGFSAYDYVVLAYATSDNAEKKTYAQRALDLLKTNPPTNADEIRKSARDIIIHGSPAAMQAYLAEQAGRADATDADRVAYGDALLSANDARAESVYGSIADPSLKRRRLALYREVNGHLCAADVQPLQEDAKAELDPKRALRAVARAALARYDEAAAKWYDDRVAHPEAVPDNQLLHNAHEALTAAAAQPGLESDLVSLLNRTAANASYLQGDWQTAMTEYQNAGGSEAMVRASQSAYAATPRPLSNKIDVSGMTRPFAACTR